MYKEGVSKFRYPLFVLRYARGILFIISFITKPWPMAIYGAGLYFSTAWTTFTGILLFAHASLDRIFGYGLKYEQGFKFTH